MTNRMRNLTILSSALLGLIVLLSFNFSTIAAQEEEYKIRPVWYNTYTVSAENYNSYQTEHFQFLWGNGGTSTQVTREFLEGNAKILEDCWDIYMNELKMTPPSRSVSSSADTTDYKLNVVILGTGIPHYEDGWAYAGLDDAGYPYLMCCTGAMIYSPETWVTPHEFGHAVHYMQGNNSWAGNVYLGPWYEAIANWFREQYLISDKYTAKQFYSTDLSYLYLRASNLTACNGRAYYEAWPILQYLTENPDGLPGYGADFVHKMLANGSSTDTLYTLIERLNPDVTLADTLGYYASHMANFDLKNRENYIDKINSFYNTKEFYEQQYYTMLEYIGNNTYIVPDERSPQAGGFNIVPLEARFKDGETVAIVNVMLNGLYDKANAQWRARIVVEQSDGSVRYSNLFSAGEKMSIEVGRNDKIYLSVAASDSVDTIGKFSVASWNLDSSEAKISFSDKTKYTYSVTLENAGIKSREISVDGIKGKMHSNGGGFVADTATVSATAYVGQNAKVLGYATVTDNAVIKDHAVVQGSAKISGSATVSGYAIVDKDAQIKDSAYIGDYAIVSGPSTISGHAKVIDSAYVTNYYTATDYAVIKGQAICFGNTTVQGKAIGQAIVYGDFFDDATIATVSAGAFAGYQCITASNNLKNNYATNNGSSYARTHYDGLFAGYDFSEDNGAVLIDKYGATHAIAINSPSHSPELNGRNGTLSFNGTDQYAILDSSMLYYNDSMQIDFSTRWNGGERNQKAFYLGGTTSYLYFTPSNNEGLPQLVISNGEKECTLTADTVFPQNCWSDVTITFDSGKIIMTIDGKNYGTSNCPVLPVEIARNGDNICFLAKGRYHSYYNGAFDYFNQYHKNVKNISLTTYTEAGRWVDLGTSDSDVNADRVLSLGVECEKTIAFGEPLYVKAMAENSKGPCVYYYYVFKEGKIYAKSGKTVAAEYSWRPLESGEYTVAVYCDNAGKRVSVKTKCIVR